MAQDAQGQAGCRSYRDPDRTHGGRNLGDAKFFDGIGELRIDYGPGYRVYFVQRQRVVIILLCGGDKSTQKTDIKKAFGMSKEI